MILVLSSMVDKAAASFVEEFPGAAASLLTCYDLAAGNTLLCYPGFERGVISIRHRSLPVAEISGVINLLPAVFPEELFFYPPEEREYQAAEFHALLCFFLSVLDCPVINRPSSLHLHGPALNPPGWFHLASRAGVPLADYSMTTASGGVTQFSPDVTGSREEAIWLNGRILPGPCAMVADHTRRLASYSGVGYLHATFVRDTEDGFRFASASSIPDVRHAGTREALYDYFLGCKTNAYDPVMGIAGR